MNKRLLISLIIGAILIALTLIAIKFANGYRIDLKNKGLKETGLLVADSDPEGAQVFIDGKLASATDDTLNLPPGEYQITIKKDGYNSWEKKLNIEKSLVAETNALLFPSVPNLTPLTYIGAQNPTPSPDGQKIAFIVSQASSAEKNGLYILDLANRALNFRSESRQISTNLDNFDFQTSQLTWSPDANQIIASGNEANLLLNANGFNQPANITDVTARLPVILAEWQETLAKKQTERLKLLPEFMLYTATASAKNLYWSPDEEKLLYTATASAQIPESLVTPLPASNTQPEQRQLEPGNIYVYDLKEDRNFLLAQTEAIEASPSNQLQEFSQQYSPFLTQNIQWFPSSRHLIKTNTDRITIVEYDNTNEVTIYSGPFEKHFAYPWPNGSQLVILTTLGQENSPTNLYAINLK
ncbi:PEGA domain-containing protein [Patescibacteria group bacterium]|nr:PEGA domain-containing protein [Patescibacteria group bacterium]MBU1931818.1 PEGA domain-containing protein [Patescibacteria group bacterium]